MNFSHFSVCSSLAAESDQGKHCSQSRNRIKSSVELIQSCFRRQIFLVNSVLFILCNRQVCQEAFIQAIQCTFSLIPLTRHLMFGNERLVFRVNLRKRPTLKQINNGHVSVIKNKNYEADIDLFFRFIKQIANSFVVQNVPLQNLNQK